MWAHSIKSSRLGPGIYVRQDLKETITFTADIKQMRNVVYMLLDHKSNLFYIGKAKNLWQRTSYHRYHILHAIKGLNGQITKYSDSNHSCHYRFAASYLQNGILNIECIPLAYFPEHWQGRNSLNENMRKIVECERQMIKEYGAKYPSQFLNRTCFVGFRNIPWGSKYNVGILNNKKQTSDSNSFQQ